MADENDLRDPDYAAGVILRLERDLENETKRRRRQAQVSDDHDTLVSVALAELRDAVHELQHETIRLGGVQAQTLALVQRLATRLGVGADVQEGDAPLESPHPMHEAEAAIQAIRRQPRRTLPDPEEMNGGAAIPAPPPPARSLPITASWRPKSFRDYIKLAVLFVVSMGAIGSACQQLAIELRRPAPPPPSAPATK